MFLSLPNVTLVALCSEPYKEQNEKALEYSCKGVKWGGVKCIVRDIKDVDDWSRQVVFDLGDFIETDFAMLIHPDGGVCHPEMWRDTWLNYDFIGCAWPLPTDDYSYRTPDGEIVRVGNSVSLRSKKLLELPRKLGLEWKPYYGNFHEDGFIACHNRRILQHNGCRFAPFEEAFLFGREVPLPENQGIKTFAYHRNIGPNALYPNFEV